MFGASLRIAGLTVVRRSCKKYKGTTMGCQFDLQHPWAQGCGHNYSLHVLKCLIRPLSCRTSEGMEIYITTSTLPLSDDDDTQRFDFDPARAISRQWQALLLRIANQAERSAGHPSTDV